MKKKKTAYEIVSEAYDELQKLKPTTEEIQEYADLVEGDYGVVTYSRHRRGQDYYFLRFHDTWKRKFGGRVHIDVGYVDEEHVDEWNVPDTTHLMLDKNRAWDFVEFIKKRRKSGKTRAFFFKRSYNGVLPFFLLPHLFLFFIGHAKGAETALGIATIFAKVDTTIRTSVNFVNHFVTSGTDEHDRSPHESIDFLSRLCSFWELLNKLVEYL